MPTLGYERSAAFQRALALLDHTCALTARFDEDPLGMGDTLNGLAAELPLLAATTFVQQDYDEATAHAQAATEHLTTFEVQARVALHLGLIKPKQFNGLAKRLDQLDHTIAALPDELFEDDGLDDEAEEPDELAEAA